MTVCVYYGGPQGMAEKDAVLAFLTVCRRKDTACLCAIFPPAGCPPIPVCIEKRAW